MSIAYPNVAERLFGHAHAIEPNAFRAIVEGPIGQRVLAGERIEVHGKKRDKERQRRGRAMAMVNAQSVRSNDGLSEYALTPEGVAVISIAGALAKRFDWLAAACGFTTYEGLSASLSSALDDYRVKAVLFDIESPGGQVDGMLDMAAQILAARDKMEIWAAANSYAYSAAYALGGCAAKLYLPQLGQVGSIGALMVHIDQSAQDQARGLKYSAIYSGARKIDGWEHAALSPGAREAAQGRVDHIRDAFADLVGRQGRISAKAALATEAASYSDIDAIDAKLADGIKTFDETLAALTAKISASSSTANRGASAMSTQKDQLMNGTSAAAVAAGQQQPAAAASETQTEQPAPAAEASVAAAAAAPAAAVVAAAAAKADKPKPGETCATCGQVMPDDDDDGMPKDPDAKVPGAAAPGGYTIEMATKTLELCTIAKVPLSTARGYVNAKMPLAKVRGELAKLAAESADATSIDGTAKAAGETEASVAQAWDDVVTKLNATLPKAAGR